MLIDHDHPPGLFDAGHCWACAHQYAIWALGSSAIGILVAAAALCRCRPRVGSCDPPGVDIGPGCPPGGRQATVG
jgi:hypothetical protein